MTHETDADNFPGVAKTKMKKKRSKLPDHIRDAIMAEAKRRDLGPYDLMKLVREHVAPTTVYEFMAGTKTLRSDIASRIMDALQLTITPKK